jgi:Outer membrane lipoprotein-sorting protein
MEEAIEAWEGEGGAVGRTEWWPRSTIADEAEQLMAKNIKSGIILTEESALSPQSMKLERKVSKGRRVLQDCRLNRRTSGARRRFFYVVMRPRTLWLLFLYLVAAVPCASAQTSRTVPTVETIIARMAQARDDNESRFRRYVVTRDYQLFGKERDKSKSQVIADVIFVPPDLKNYSIQQTNGTGLGERIVRRMLASEAEIAKDCLSTDFSAANYEFRFVREEDVSGQRCYVLELLPKRKDRNLLRGNIWVDATTYLLRRTEGEPAKIPSWWLRDVRIALLYGDVSGMWLQTALEATATVRILGPYTMVSRDVKYELGKAVVAARPKQALKAYAGKISSTRHDSRTSNVIRW